MPAAASDLQRTQPSTRRERATPAAGMWWRQEGRGQGDLPDPCHLGWIASLSGSSSSGTAANSRHAGGVSYCCTAATVHFLSIIYNRAPPRRMLEVAAGDTRKLAEYGHEDPDLPTKQS